MTFVTKEQSSKEIDFAKKVIDAFKAKNFDNYKIFIPTKEDYETLYHDKGMVRGLGVDTDEKYKASLALYEKKAESIYKREFKRLLTRGEKLNLDWFQITFLKFVFEKFKPKDSSHFFLSGYINFKYQNAIYFYLV